MATRTYKQAEVDAAVNHLLHGGPNGAPLTLEQYFWELGVGTAAQPNGLAFADCIYLAIQQNHPLIAEAPQLYRPPFLSPQRKYEWTGVTLEFPWGPSGKIGNKDCQIVG